MRYTEKGFFKPSEIVVVLILLSIVGFILLPRFCDYGYHKPTEAETKANIHTIQIALERFYVDHNEYPPYLLGGDTEGWENWHARWDGVNDIDMGDGRIASNDVVVDPLIDQDYLYS